MGKSLRVLILVPHLGRGAADKVAALVAGGLSQEKYEVHLGLIAQSHAGPETLPPWVTIHRLAAGRVRSGAFPLLCLIRRIQPDVVLSGDAHLNVLALLLRPLFPRKTRVFVRQDTSLSSVTKSRNVPWYTSLLRRVLYRRADRVVCSSSAVADALTPQLGIGTLRIAVLADPADPSAIRTASAANDLQPPCWTGPGPHLLAVGRLAHEKGFDLLLEALVVVRQRFPSADILIAGAGPEEAALKAQRQSLGLENAVRLPGYVPRPYRFFPGASLFVLPSRSEDMPNAILEAAAGGLPIVATRALGNIGRLLHNCSRAWLAPEVSAESIASTLVNALEELNSSPRLHRSFSTPEAQ